MNSRNVVTYMAVLAACAAVAPAAVLQVGPGRTYTTIAQGVAAALAGDTIEIDSGTYTGAQCLATINKSNLTLRGVGQTRPVLDANQMAQSKKGIFVISGTNTTVENLEFKNCYVAPIDGWNGAGIRQESANLTVRNCWFHHNQNGILAGATSGNILIEYSEFNHNGIGEPGQTHNIYINACTSFTLQHCYIHDAVEGHEVKTRALNNKILYNLIHSEGTGSREVQIAQGGVAYIIGNVIRQGPNTHNAEIIAYGGEGTNANPYLYIANNTIINERPNGAVVLMKNNSTVAGTALLQNNVIQLPYGNEVLISGSGGGVVTQVTNWNTPNANLANVAAHDYRLTAASLGAIDAGTALGFGFNSYPLTAVYQYVHPYGREDRPTASTIDTGAYEYVVPNQNPTVDAGADVAAVYEGRPVDLHATADDPDSDPLSYLWSQTAGKTVSLTGASTADASFTAPSLANKAESLLTLQVQVNDGNGGTASDSVNVQVYMKGDATRDHKVNVFDLQKLANSWDKQQGQAGYDATCDFNGDNKVNVFDLQAMSSNWNKTLP